MERIVRDQHRQTGFTLDQGNLLRRAAVLDTSGARAAEIFSLSGEIFLAVPQLAYDVEGTPAQMNGGDSNTEMLIFRWRDGGFVVDTTLAVPGGEDAEFFQIGEQSFLAVASGRQGAGPYEPNVDSTVFRLEGEQWVPFQRFPGFLAKQWKYLRFGRRHFLCLALGVSVEGVTAVNPRQSCIFEWDGSGFRLFQTLDGPWGYNWTKIEAGQRHFLAYADHTGQSVILEWSGSTFETFQRFEGKTGRAFEVLRPDGRLQLAFAAIADDTEIYEWNGSAFKPTQTLSGPGGREFASMMIGNTLYLVLVRFIEGSPKDPKTDLMSYIYRWNGETWVKVEAFATFGATDAAFFRADGKVFLVVTNSLTPEVRFRQETHVYEFLG